MANLELNFLVMSKKTFKLSLILILTVLILSGCTLPWEKKKTPPTEEPIIEEPVVEEEVVRTNDLKKFSDVAELQQFLEENSSDTNLTFGTPLARGAMEISLMMNSLSATGRNEGVAVSSDSSGNTLDYSTTNNQVAGVDEADIIKTDGNFIYALVRNDLFIIKANPAGETQVISKITFKSRPLDLFISGTSLAVFGNDDQIFTTELFQSFRRQTGYTFFKVFNLTDPASPQLVRDLDFEGSYTNSRLIGDYVYFITNNYAYYIENEQLTPRVLEAGAVLSSDCASVSRCFAPDVYYFDIPYDSYNYTSITAINIADNNEAINGQIYLMNNGQNLYVSKNNLYITYTEYLNEYELEQEIKRERVLTSLSAGDQDKIKKIEAVANFILTTDEKKMKVATIIDRYLSSLTEAEQSIWQENIDTTLLNRLKQKSKEMEKTVIHKIAISGKIIEYKAKGEVGGQVLNQFSMDENGSYFRLATTRSSMWSRLFDRPQDSYSNIYILDVDLQIVGSLENLATTERIYAARFMGDRLYLVTFKQTDPLYVVSLVDPTKPEVLGAVKVPGFSTYLHPVDKNGTKLLGLGREAEESESGGVKVKGLKLSLFDFSDLSRPRELDSYLLGDERSDSIALYDHKAFLYSEEKNILSIPAILRENNGRLSFAGALIFTLNDNSISLKGRIDHSAGGYFTQTDYWQGFNYFDNTVKRSLYINDNLYTFSNKFLKINNLTDLSEVKSLILTSGDDDYIITSPPLPEETITPEPMIENLENPLEEVIIKESIAPEIDTSLPEVPDTPTEP